MDQIILCVSTGRSGTVSLHRMLEYVFARNGFAGPCFHELDCPELYNHFARFCETGEQGALDAARELIARWRPGCAIVGNGYQQFLPLIHELHGAKVRLVHLQREREACIASLVRNMAHYPEFHHYYAEGFERMPPEAIQLARFAAFHFKEMSYADWLSLSVSERAGWYYDKTHELIARAEPLFPGHLSLRTEALSEPQTLARLTHWLDPQWQVPPPLRIHLNADWIDAGRLSSLSPGENQQLLDFYRDFDFVNYARHYFDGTGFFWNKILARMERLGPEQRRELVTVSRRFLRQRLEQLDQIEAQLGQGDQIK
ncbi:MAG: hypothetical protein ACAI44_17030 [Candidatus Sericytochromatia bacterium]